MPKKEKTAEVEVLPPEMSHPGAYHNKLLLEWKAPEFISHPKSATWFLMASIVILLLIVYAIYTNSATMAIVFIVLAGVYYLTHRQTHRMIDIKITELGIYMDEKFYPYNMINSFWVVYHPPYVHTLNLRLGTKSRTKITIQLDQQNPVEVRKLLAREIPEIEGEEESFGDALVRLLRL